MQIRIGRCCGGRHQLRRRHRLLNLPDLLGVFLIFFLPDLSINLVSVSGKDFRLDRNSRKERKKEIFDLGEEHEVYERKGSESERASGAVTLKLCVCVYSLEQDKKGRKKLRHYIVHLYIHTS